MNPELYDLALAKFLQTEPVLGNFIVTFKDISDELQEDTGMSVGIFILKSGSEIYYVPVVSKGENIYPIDSVFCASTGMFYPLTKKTVEQIVNSSQNTQGKAMKLPANIVTNPDLTSLINPPRTGKYIAASTSRISDFLATMPEYLKSFTMEKISQERSVYESLNKLFPIQDILASLKPAPKSLAAETNHAPISVLTGAPVGGSLDAAQIQQILDHGYVIEGTQPEHRVAISSVSYEDGCFTQVQSIDGNTDYEIMFERGGAREAFIPKMMDIGQSFSTKRTSVALFTNGTYAVSDTFIAKGTKLDRRDVLDTIFSHNPPVLPKDVEMGDVFAIVDTDASLLGVFRAQSIVLTNMGVEITCSATAGFDMGYVKIYALRNYGLTPSMIGKNLYMPFSSLVIKLGDNVSGELERSVNSAAKKHEISEAGILGDQLNIGFDGVEFSINGQMMGKEANVMKRLVVEEGIDPTLAHTFIKQAQERRFTKVYLSKKAEAGLRAGEIPQFGDQPEPQGQVGLNGSFIPNVQKSLQVGDAQSTEATIISELLQAPDMLELVGEYLPDLEEAIDKLGRILFLSRVHIDQLANNNDSENVFAFLTQLKAVYKMLGDNVVKLKELITLNPTPKK